MFSYILSTHIHLLFTVYKVLYYILKTHMTHHIIPSLKEITVKLKKYTKTNKSKNAVQNTIH